MREGGFIAAFYGMNNIGKSSVIRGIVEKLGEKAFSLKYPIYNIPSGRRINAYLRGGNPEGLTPIEAQRIFAQNRVDFEPQLLKMSKRRIAVLEDYNGTGKAWGMITTGATIEEMEEINKGQLEPDLNVLLDGERFKGAIEANHKHESIDDEAWERGRRIHLELAKRYGWEIVEVRFGELEREIDECVELIKTEIERRKIL